MLCGAVLGAPACALTYDLISTPGKDIITPTGNAVSSGTVTVAVTPHSAWQPNDPFGRGAVWVSNALTGDGDPVSQPTVFTNDADNDIILVFNETFNTTTTAYLELTLWADDTVRVWVDGELKFDWNTTQDVCADGPISCEPDEYGTIYALLGAGAHTVRIDAYQIGAGPFGVLYSGEIREVPEPESAPLLGAGLISLVAVARRRRKRS